VVEVLIVLLAYSLICWGFDYFKTFCSRS